MHILYIIYSSHSLLESNLDSSHIGYVEFGPNPSIPRIWSRLSSFLPHVGPSYPMSEVLKTSDC